MADQLARLKAALADRYAIERELGRGGMATVYLARDLKHGRLVAIKVLRPEIAAAPGPARVLRAIATPGYMSPEEAMGSERVDGRSDLYALACVLYEMLAGEPPFTGPSAESVARQHVAAPAPHISVMRPAIPPAIEEAIVRALAKTPADRFPTAAEFVEALAAPAQRMRDPGRRTSRLAAWAGLAATLVAVAAGLFVLSRPHGTPALAGPTGQSIAMLPFVNMSGAPQAEYLSDGISE